MTKLIIQIPCFNEAENIGKTISEIPKTFSGVDSVEILVIDDGSVDNTAEIAKSCGASVVRISNNSGLANAFRTGLQEALIKNADLIVNTDADNQYNSGDIQKLIQPILEGKADMVVGARNIDSIKEFSLFKKILQKFGSAVLRLFSSTKVADAPSGFRAFSKNAALKLNVFDNYTYTMETLIQAGAKGLNVLSVPIGVNSQTRKSRLVKNIFDYVFKSVKTMLRMFIVYRPFRFFAAIASIVGITGLILAFRFLHYYFTGSGNGHVQSLILSSILCISSMLLFVVAVIGDLLAINRKLLEDIQTRVRKIEIKNSDKLN